MLVTKMNETEDKHMHTGLVLCQFVLCLFALVPLSNIHQFLIYALSFLVLCPLVKLHLFKPFFLMGISFLIYTQFFRNAART